MPVRYTSPRLQQQQSMNSNLVHRNNMDNSTMTNISINTKLSPLNTFNLDAFYNTPTTTATSSLSSTSMAAAAVAPAPVPYPAAAPAQVPIQGQFQTGFPAAPQPQPAQAQSFGPTQVYNEEIIRRNLGCPQLSTVDMLKLATKAIIYGSIRDDIQPPNLHVFFNSMIFVFSEGLGAVLTIAWNPNSTATRSQTAASTLPPPIHTKSNSNSNHFQDEHEEITALDVDIPDLDQIVDEIVHFLDNDESLPPLPDLYSPQEQHQPKEGHSNTTFPVSTPSKQYQIEITSTSPEVPSYPYHQNQNQNQKVSVEDGIEIRVANGLIKDLLYRFGPLIADRSTLVQRVKNAIKLNRAPIQRIDGNRCLWMDATWVYITESDMSTLVDMFRKADYQKFPQRITAILATKRRSGFSQHQHHGRSTSGFLFSGKGSGFLASSRRSVQSSAMSHSKRTLSSLTVGGETESILSDGNSSSGLLINTEYHTIYIKPIIERMRLMMGRNVTKTDIMYIVDNAIKHGAKRQISKRTFEFKHDRYTVVMSKSLKTILDVAVSAEKEEGDQVITVHPDVVSIISKKCPALDYFTIQKLAQKAKETEKFVTKKNDYRQQFIYQFCDCRIVFASNHTTIVEMQCNNPSTMNMNIELLSQ